MSVILNVLSVGVAFMALLVTLDYIVHADNLFERIVWLLVLLGILAGLAYYFMNTN